MTLPEPFIAQMSAQLGGELDTFLQALQAPPPTSIRFNALKQTKRSENSDGVKWNADGFYLPERPIFTLDPLLHAGAYYVQEASSMFITEAARQLLALDKPLRALDLCAAPGGKSTLLASVLHPESLLLCNEVIKPRYRILRENLTKWGAPNTHAASHDSKDFTRLPGFFDLILVDAPCSGEGLFRKDAKAIQEWSPENVQRCAARQKRILADAYQALAPGGTLIYCTCTYNEQENEQNADWLTREFALEPLPLETPEDWSIMHRDFGHQFYPHRVRGEGFYIACFRKTDNQTAIRAKTKAFAKWKPLPKRAQGILQDWLESPEDFAFFQNEKGKLFGILASQVSDCQAIAQSLRSINLGLALGSVKGKGFVPAHALALSTAIKQDLPKFALQKDHALRFLKKETLPIAESPAGWLLASYDGQRLGWLKGIGNRINNYFPKDWRILMELPSEN